MPQGRRYGKYNKRMRRKSVNRRGRRRRLVQDTVFNPTGSTRADFIQALKKVSYSVARVGFTKLGMHAQKAFDKWYSTSRSPGRPSPRGPAMKSKRDNKNRHDDLKQGKNPGSMNTGRGFTTSARGYAHTQHRSVIPKWKQDRIKKYDNNVWQTILLSRSNRLTNSNNTLETSRYPIKAPECLDSERVQSMIFQPFCSHFSGIHTSHYKHVLQTGTGAGNVLIHNTTVDGRLDTIQNQVDSGRHNMSGDVDGSGAGIIVHANDTTATSTARGIGNRAQINQHYDQLVKQTKVDLVFTASRAFPMKVSVSLVRYIEPTAPYSMTAADKMELCNNLTNRGLNYQRFKVEWLHEFVLPGLVVNKTPPTHSVNKTLAHNFMQTNTFQQDTIAEAQTAASQLQLGKSIATHTNEVADGFMSGSYVIMIKYRKMQKPQQFTYTRTIHNDTGTDANLGEITVPVLSEQSFDVPNNTGTSTTSSDGSPLNQQGNESLGSFYLHGKIGTQWGFRRETEAIPSLMSGTASSANFKKMQSLNITPDLIDSNDDGIYTKSANAQNLQSSTANSTP